MQREEHPEAKEIVETLVKEGYVAYYAGGWVRDYLLNCPSDDIDIATSAPPEVIQKLFPKTVPIGIAFGIVLVLIADKQFEVATFRNDLGYVDGRRPTQIEFSTAEEDAKRRDFTINGMFYDPLKEEIHDFVGGKIDIEKKIIRAIGNPHERIREDRLRMIRAVRLACRLHFAIDPETIKAIKAHALELFPAVAVERIWQEFCKMANFPGFRSALLTLHEYGLLQTIFPALKDVSHKEIERLSHAMDDFSSETPVIAYILELFPHFSKEEKIQLCKKMKLSTKEIQFAQVLHEAEKLHQNSKTEKIEWAYFYANSYSTKCVQVLAARLDIHSRHAFLEAYEKRKASLAGAVQRIAERKPLVSSEDLKERGISPGIKMGKLLMEAESIAINEGLDDKEEVIRKLKKKPIWLSEPEGK